MNPANPASPSSVDGTVILRIEGQSLETDRHLAPNLGTPRNLTPKSGASGGSGGSTAIQKSGGFRGSGGSGGSGGGGFGGSTARATVARSWARLNVLYVNHESIVARLKAMPSFAVMEIIATDDAESRALLVNGTHKQIEQLRVVLARLEEEAMTQMTQMNSVTKPAQMPS
jgi:hypothetical protein